MARICSRRACSSIPRHTRASSVQMLFTMRQLKCASVMYCKTGGSTDVSVHSCQVSVRTVCMRLLAAQDAQAQLSLRADKNMGVH